MRILERLHQVDAIRGVICLWCIGMVASSCTGCPLFTQPPDSNVECRLDRDCSKGQLCQDGRCVEKSSCQADTDCAPFLKCSPLTWQCTLREGFGGECGPNNNNNPCALGQFCALGKCRETSSAIQCSRRFQCPEGLVCDRLSFYCIEEAPCTLATDSQHPYPELACDPGDTCDADSGVCMSTAPPQCHADQVPNGCAADEICSPNGQCVQCVTSADCGPGLRCNTRAGLCEGQNICRRDSDCHAPLICDRDTALCTVPPAPCANDYQCALGEYCDPVRHTCQPREGQCEDDRLEPNEAPPGARTINLSNAEARLDDLMLCPNNPDMYAADLLPGDQLTTRILNVAASARAEITVVGPDQLTTWRFAEAPPRGNGTVSFVAQTEAKHFIRVISPAGKSAYSLQFVRTASTACQADPFEPNNSQDGAKDAELFGVHVLSLCPGDRDWFALKAPGGQTPTVRKGQLLTVELRGPLEADLDMVLADDLGQVLATTQGPGSHEVIAYRFGADTNLVLGVMPYGAGSSGPYTLEITLDEAFTCTADRYDQPPSNPPPAPGDELDGGSMTDSGETGDAGDVIDAGDSVDAAVEALDASVADASVEPAWGNNTRGTATPVGREGLNADLTICTSDIDWFVVDAWEFQRVLVTATWPRGESGVMLEGYGVDPLPVESSSGAGVAALSMRGTPEGKVWVAVKGAGSAVTPYVLDIQVEYVTDCKIDEHEPDNTPALAGPAPAEGVYTLCFGDRDFFRLNAGAGKRVKVDVDFSIADGDIDLAVLLPDGDTTLVRSEGVEGHESVDVIIPADPTDAGYGSHFLMVYPARSDTLARYRLVVNVLSP